MSEYQYYEFLAVDRPLEDHKLGELRALSTRARITPTSFVNTYDWGDFRGDPCSLMERYFDAFLYLANWGTRRLMIRLPARLLGLATVQRYCVGEAASAWVNEDHVILDLISEDDSGYWEESGDGWLASIIPARAELASGDLRVLYLAWLLLAQIGELSDNVVEPPVPPNLQTLSAPLRSLTDSLRIDEDLLAVAGTASGRSAANDMLEEELAEWIERLPVAEKNALLLQVAQGENVHMGVELLRRFRGQSAAGETDTGERTVAELLDAAEGRRSERERVAAERREEKRLRRERQAAIAREKYLDSLALKQDQAWQRVSMLIDTKNPGKYDAAITLLKDLRAALERESRIEAFEQRVQQLRLQHQRKHSLLERLDQAGLGRAGW